jgi:hypothetical protein
MKQIYVLPKLEDCIFATSLIMDVQYFGFYDLFLGILLVI